MSTEYETFIDNKREAVIESGFACELDVPYLHDWQRDVTTWALRIGRAAIFADTGLGKTRMQLEWAHRVVQHTGGRVLILAPLAVAGQTAREAVTCWIPDVRVVREAHEVRDGITVVNYDRLHKLDATQFVGVVLDESSILKSYSGPTKTALCATFANTPYRLCCTATPAPNDHLELGNHSEFLGVLSSHKMIARWFINDTSEFGTYRLKGHAVEPFWDWVCSWARCVGLPSDLGAYSDEGYVLPPLNVQRRTVAVDVTQNAGGSLFRVVETSATALHRERRRTASARADAVAALIAAGPTEPWVVWCDTNYDADAIVERVPEALEVHGSQDADEKERRLVAFSEGRSRVIVTKPKLAAFGLNWQHCARVAFVGPSYSYEQMYQAIRRCWRFGQRRPVDVYVVSASTEGSVLDVLARKAADHDAMKVEMFAASRRAQARAARRAGYDPRVRGRLPDWLTWEVTT